MSNPLHYDSNRDNKNAPPNKKVEPMTGKPDVDLKKLEQVFGSIPKNIQIDWIVASLNNGAGIVELDGAHKNFIVTRLLALAEENEESFKRGIIEGETKQAKLELAARDRFLEDLYRETKIIVGEKKTRRIQEAMRVRKETP